MKRFSVRTNTDFFDKARYWQTYGLKVWYLPYSSQEIFEKKEKSSQLAILTFTSISGVARSRLKRTAREAFTASTKKMPAGLWAVAVFKQTQEWDLTQFKEKIVPLFSFFNKKRPIAT